MVSNRKLLFQGSIFRCQPLVSGGVLQYVVYPVAVNEVWYCCWMVEVRLIKLAGPFADDFVCNKKTNYLWTMSCTRVARCLGSGKIKAFSCIILWIIFQLSNYRDESQSLDGKMTLFWQRLLSANDLYTCFSMNNLIWKIAATLQENACFHFQQDRNLQFSPNQKKNNNIKHN